MNDRDFTLDLDESLSELRRPAIPSTLVGIIENNDCRGKATLEYQHVGGDHDNWVFVKNKSSTAAITVTLKCDFFYEGQHRQDYRTVTVTPGAREHIGSTRWRTQEFIWSIVGCSGG